MYQKNQFNFVRDRSIREVGMYSRMLEGLEKRKETYIWYLLIYLDVLEKKYRHIGAIDAKDIYEEVVIGVKIIGGDWWKNYRRRNRNLFIIVGLLGGECDIFFIK